LRVEIITQLLFSPPKGDQRLLQTVKEPFMTPSRYSPPHTGKHNGTGS
jgi:hypothetical protein